MIFFVRKKVWSEVKDELFACYFKPYVSKILHTYRPLVYVDCFAGKGRFDDGEPGSPIIALDIINECLTNSKTDKASVSTNFIELNHADELSSNLKGYEDITIISGFYEKEIESLLLNKDGCNIFLYLDPYGIKALEHSIFESFANRNFNSIELLINLNSFGFFREACNALGTKYENDLIFEDLIEYDPTRLNASKKSIEALNEIAGGTYWQPVVEDYKKGNIDGYKAEEIITSEYCKQLGESYSYVLNMPLRIKKGQRPKYRMIHATNHHDGCLIMVDNIYNRWQVIQNLQNCGQLSMWEEDCENKIVDKIKIENKVIEHFSRYETKTSLSVALANFFVEYGPICNTKTIRDILRKYEGKKIGIERNPSKTKKTGKPTTFMTEIKNKKIDIWWLT